MKISVIMPVYNAEKYLREAIDSILAQTYTDFEFIIIDDGSVDSSPEIVRSYTDERIRFYQNEHNMGVAATLNRGLDLAEGKYIARMDSDDISLPERFAKQVEYMDAHPDVIVCGGNIMLFAENGDLGVCRYPKNDKEIKTALLLSSPFAHPAVMLRRETMERHAVHYDSAFEKIEDFHMWSILQPYGCFYNLPEIILRYRKHEKQVCVTASDVQLDGNARLYQTYLSEKTGISDAEALTTAQVFGGREVSDTVFAQFQTVCQKMKENLPVDYNQEQFSGILKSCLIEYSLRYKKRLALNSIALIGLKAYVYIVLMNSWSNR